MKQLEPNCIAVLAPIRVCGAKTRRVICELPAHEVLVVDRFDGERPWPCRACGSVTNSWRIESRIHQHGRLFSCACRLTRIDGGDPDAITETEKELAV